MAIVADAVANVARIEAEEAAALAATADAAALAEAAITGMLEAQPAGSRTFSLPLEPGASNHILTWHNRAYWLSLCEWVVTTTDRGKAALKRCGIAAATFLRGCAAHAAAAESSTGRRVTACLDTLITRSGLSVDQLKRTRRVLLALDLGVEQARGKLLNAVEREAAARLYEQVHGHAPARLQRGAASVWALSAPRWAVEEMPAPERTTRPVPTRRRKAAPTSSRPAGSRPRSSRGSAPQSSSGSFSGVLSVRKDHQARAHAPAGKDLHTTHGRDLDRQRAAADLVHRIPALDVVTGYNGVVGEQRTHIGAVCDLLVEACIDTTRWTGADIATALNLDGRARGWSWPTLDSMTSPLRLVAWRLGQIDWTSPSPTERALTGRLAACETPSTTAHRLAAVRRVVMATDAAVQGPPASAEHRRAVRERFAAELAARKAVTA
ncbi:hypothetical protein [Prescottella subtropica]|uniref:hypothetical protein n=1 Tax=Prescottella subtropica TaxID=2545757 RepID=UPI0010FA0618|nr:hypothetical protein [Prescottella subtropica]